VLDDLDRIPVCVEYKLDGKTLQAMPSTTRELDHISAVYEYLPGWQESTYGISEFSKLPARAQEYVRFLEKLTCVEVGCISTGPERNETIVVPETRFEQLAFQVV
jgi:adenylosuccinate synthase